MNKQQLYTFGGALLASTALSGGANALTWGKVNVSLQFSTTAINIANTVFSTTASTANGVSITANGANRIAARFSNVYSVLSVPTIAFSVESTIAGAQFSGIPTRANAAFLLVGTGGSTFVGTVGASTACSGSFALGTQFVLEGCTAQAFTGGGGASVNIGGLMFSGVAFTNASGLATAGNSVSLTGRVYNTSSQSTFEAASTGSVITSVTAFTTTISPAANVVVSAITTPLAFTALSSGNIGTSTLTMDLANIAITGAGGFNANLSTAAIPGTAISSARISVTSAILSSAAVAKVELHANGAIVGTAQTTVANFSGGTVTFDVADASHSSYKVLVSFNGTAAIPQAAAGAVSVSYGAEGNTQAPASATGLSSASNQGGFRAEVNMFGASNAAPYGSYLRIHNNGGVAGTATITIRNDAHDQGGMLGSAFTTATIQPGGTMQLGAAEMEGTTTSTKRPAGGANIPTASRTGAYTVQVTGPIVGYVQHILFDGSSVADLSSFRNGGQTTNNAAP